MKKSTLSTAILLVSILNLGSTFPAVAQGLFDMPGQEHIDRGTMDRNRRSRGQNKTLWGTSGNDSARDGNITYSSKRAVITTEANGVNVRTGPGLNHEIVTQVHNGRDVEAIGNTADGKWTQLKCGDCPPGGEIWIFSEFIRMR